LLNNLTIIQSRLFAFLPRLTSKRSKRIGREIFWITIGQVAATIGTLVGVRLLTGVLSPNIYGELALGMTASMLVNQVILGPVSNAALRFFAPAREAGHLRSFLIAVKGLVQKATGLMLLVGGAFSLVLFLSAQFHWFLLSVSALLFALFAGYNSVLDSMQSAARQRGIVAWHNAIGSWGRFLLAIGLVVWLGANSAIAMLGYVIASIAVLISQVIYFKRKLLADSNSIPDEIAPIKDWRPQMFSYAWPFASWGIFTWVQMASDRWALQIFTSTHEVGLYAVLYQLGYYPMSMATGMAMQLLAPIFYERAGDASESQRCTDVNKLSWRFTILTLGGTGVAFLLALLFHRQIFQIFVAREYISVSYLLPWMLLAGGIFAAGQTIALDLMSQMKTRVMITAKIVTALLGVLLNIAGAYWYGTNGIVITGVFFSVIYFVWMKMLSKRTFEKATCVL
jgi:O-antigen/teichoic acid export membrane protein